MKKKVVKVLIIILVLIAAVGGIAYYMQDGEENDSLPVLNEESTGEPVNEYVIKNMDVYDINELIPVFETIESPYIWFEDGEMYNDYYEHIATGITKEEFEKRLAESTVVPGILKYKDIEKMCEHAETAINQLTKKDGNVGVAMFATYVAYNGGSEIAALNGAIVQPNGEDLTSKSHYRDMGLSLDVENAETKALLVRDGESVVYYALVEAEVTCKKNDGEFSKLEWIPEQDETNKVTFIINFDSMSGINSVFINNYGIYSYEAINAE